MTPPINSVTTRGFGLSGGLAGDPGLVATSGYGIAPEEAVAVACLVPPAPVVGTGIY